MDNESILNLLNNVRDKKISVDEAKKSLRDMPFKDLDFVKLDFHRDIRTGIGEVVYCKNKTPSQLKLICQELKKTKKQAVIYSRANKKKAKLLLSIDSDLKYNKLASMVYKKRKKILSDNLILIITGGTSDIPVAEEAACTADVMGNKIERHFDIGIAGIHRLFSIYDRLQKASVIIAIAGMEGALPSVVSGLVSVPVIAVPTSIGYGANFGGLASLLTMLNSCSPGVSVVNIDNGFGAGYLASIINQGKNK